MEIKSYDEEHIEKMFQIIDKDNKKFINANDI